MACGYKVAAGLLNRDRVRVFVGSGDAPCGCSRGCWGGDCVASRCSLWWCFRLVVSIWKALLSMSVRKKVPHPPLMTIILLLVQQLVLHCFPRTRSPHHSLGVDPQVYLPLHGSFQDVFGRHAAADLQSIEEHLTVQTVSCSLQAWNNKTTEYMFVHL